MRALILIISIILTFNVVKSQITIDPHFPTSQPPWRPWSRRCEAGILSSKLPSIDNAGWVGQQIAIRTMFLSWLRLQNWCPPDTSNFPRPLAPDWLARHPRWWPASHTPPHRHPTLKHALSLFSDFTSVQIVEQSNYMYMGISPA